MRHIIRAAAATLLLATAPIVGAVTVFDFTGEMLFDGLGFFGGQSVTGSLAFDETIPDGSPDADFGLYGPPPAVTAFDLSIGGNALVARALGGSNIVVDLATVGVDRVTFRGFGIAFAGAVSSCADTASCVMELGFFDGTETLLAGNLPVDSLPSVAQLASMGFIQGRIIILGGSSVEFEITALAPRSIPEPGTLALFVALLAVVGRRVARRA